MLLPIETPQLSVMDQYHQSASSESTPSPPTPHISEDEDVPPLPPPLDLPDMGHSPREDTRIPTLLVVLFYNYNYFILLAY